MKTSKAKHILTKHSRLVRRLALFLFAFLLLCSSFPLFNYQSSLVSAEESTDTRKLLNGSFEEKQTWTSAYSQPDQSKVPAWNTTAFQGKIELFRANPSTYIKNVKLTPTDGTFAAELNADEESTLYQVVSTTPSSIYEWGLDHGGRNGMDTMALIIGPNQTNAPSKPSKAGRDQFMQMVDWLIEQGQTSFKTVAGLGEQLTVYSKKFGTKGTFEDNAGNNAFSMTPSSIYTEEWKIWIIADGKAKEGETENPWQSYGSNAANAEEGEGSGNSGSQLDKYYDYVVPVKQTETLFSFVSVGWVDTIAPPGKEATYGNFLDNINFKIYHPLSGGTTHHGSAIVSSSDGESEGEGSSEGHEITIGHNLATHVVDGEPLKIQAVIKKGDFEDGCLFLGVYETRQDENGKNVTVFLQTAGNTIDDDESLTDEDKAGKWIKSVNENGDVIYTYYVEQITSATDLQFIFIKSPTVTYEPNGGKPYVIEDRPHQDEVENVYSFKPLGAEIGEDSFIAPYVSKAAEGQNDGWKFMGWKLTGDIVDGIPDDDKVNADQLGSMILPAEHTIACDYDVNGASGERAAQHFKIYDGSVSLEKQLHYNDIAEGEIDSVIWQDNGEEKLYSNVHRGITMVAQWRWRQVIIPQLVTKVFNEETGEVTETITDSTVGGTVGFSNVTDESDSNYEPAYTENGGKAYYAALNDSVIINAYENEGCRFIGWYDENNNLITTNPEFLYLENKESVKTYYARFSNTVTQTYIRQIRNGDSWDDTENDNIGTLSRYTYTDAVGNSITSTATAKKGYRFVGWYDSEGNEVPDSMIASDGVTISYKTKGDATYYARYENAYTLTVKKVDADNSGAPLAGAEFSLYRKDSEGKSTVEYNGEKIKCTVVGSAVTALSSDKTKATAVFTDKLYLENEYYLVETKPPSGYSILDTPYKITVNDYGSSATIDDATQPLSGKNITIELENHLTIHMPISGTQFTEDLFAAEGLTLMSAAAIGLFVLEIFRRRERRN